MVQPPAAFAWQCHPVGSSLCALVEEIKQPIEAPVWSPAWRASNPVRFPGEARQSKGFPGCGSVPDGRHAGGRRPRTVADARCWSLGSPLAAVGPGRRVGPVPGGITAWHYRALVSVFTSLPETRAPHAGSRHPTGRPDKRPTAPPTIGSRKAYTEPVSDGRWCSAIGTSPVGSA